ncbi:hypothetical protein KNP414_01240 [Paenibacillus mucilaginosus KNP414]|uniref:Uncharacterized protein n=1 Tax=Paenibacillus mucilaginosus (strain KNP414) TaxID=1036673 RepID=F8FHA3_PAEMK|nr:hypothetical protein KNP414_01240 [Paenibacillus mucilaginosus KNP414]
METKVKGEERMKTLVCLQILSIGLSTVTFLLQWRKKQIKQ